VQSGVQVTELTAMQATAVFASVRLIAGTIASLPLPIYKRNGRAKERDTGHPVYKLLHDRPNPELSSFQWRQTGIAHQLLYGNWYSEVEYAQGKVRALWPIPPWRVKIRRGSRGFKYYDVEIPNGATQQIPATNMLHIPNISIDSDGSGMSCIRAGAEAVGLALAAETYGARFFGEGTNVGAIIEHPGKISPDRREGFVDQMRAAYSGLKKSHRLMLLEEGMKLTKVGIPPNEAQFLETRKFQVAEIGRLFGITQLHKIGDLERATFSNVEHLGIEFVTDTIRPLLVNIEQEFNYKFFDETDAFTEFVLDGLLRGDTETRYKAYATARQWGWMSANDIRELENMNPLPDEQGEIYLIPMNMIPAERAELIEPKETIREVRAIENRKQSAIVRHRVAASYEGMARSVVQGIVSRERQHVVKAVKKHMAERGVETFNDWLEDFYTEFRGYIKKELKPVIASIAGAVAPLAAEEVGGQVDQSRIDAVVEDLSERCATRHIIKSRSTIKKIINDSYRSTESRDDEVIEKVEEKMNHWEKNRPDSYVSNGLINTASEAAIAVFIGAGIMRLRWVAMGSETCPYCEELDGKIVGIEQPFVAEYDILQSEDGSMRINKPTRNPPLHDGCVCGIVPEY